MSTLIATGSNYVVAYQARHTYTPLVFRNRSQFDEWMQEDHPGGIVAVTSAHGRIQPALDMRQYSLPEFITAEFTKISQEAITMTTTIQSPLVGGTPYQPTATDLAKAREQAKAAQALAAAAASKPAPRSEALIAVERLAAHVDEINGDLCRRLYALHTAIDNLSTKVSALVDALVAQPAAAPAAQPGNGDRALESIDVAVVSHGFSDGKHVVRVKGGRYMRHGVPLYPECAAQLGFADFTGIPMGETPAAQVPNFPRRVTVELEKVVKEDGATSMQPRRVTGAA